MSAIGFAHRVARRRHTCSWCGQVIIPKERYAYWCWLDGHNASTVKMHEECNDACNAELDSDETFEPYQNERPKP